eukprot:8658076-Pyramimonas_sp.AAC.1
MTVLTTAYGWALRQDNVGRLGHSSGLRWVPGGHRGAVLAPFGAGLFEGSLDTNVGLQRAVVDTPGPRERAQLQ